MDVDGPHAAEGEEASYRFERETQKECGQINETHCVNRVERMFAVCREPIEMFGAVMDGMKSPQKFEAMLQAMSPINKKIAEQNHFDRLKPPRLRPDRGTQGDGNDDIKPAAEELQHCKNAASPEQILAEEEPEISPPMRSKEWLLFGRESFL